MCTCTCGYEERPCFPLLFLRSRDALWFLPLGTPCSPATVSDRVDYACLTFAHLALGRDLLVVTVGGIPRDLAGPQCDPYHSVCIANHQQGQEVDQDGHTDVVPVRQTEESVVETAGH